MCAAIFLVPPTRDSRDQTQDFGKWLILILSQSRSCECQLFKSNFRFN
jgi:hypothetical protein